MTIYNQSIDILASGRVSDLERDASSSTAEVPSENAHGEPIAIGASPRGR